MIMVGLFFMFKPTLEEKYWDVQKYNPTVRADIGLGLL
jgi:hypothetical protein